MAVRLRLRRMGRKKRPFYRIVVADSRSPRDGRFIEEIGYYNPLTHPATVEVNEDRALYWLGVGAEPTETVKSLLRRKGIILRFHLQKQGLPPEKIEEEMKKWEVLQLEKQRKLEAELAAQKGGTPEESVQPEAETESETTEAETPAESEPTEAASSEQDVAASSDNAEAEKKEE